MAALALLAALVIPSRALCQTANPREGWDFAFRNFVIAAWNPPAATDAEYQLYREAGFNLIMSPRYPLPDLALELALKHGLKLMVDTYTPNDKPWGGAADAYTPHPSHHPATLTELKWLHERYGKHPALAGYLLGDDYGSLPPELAATTAFLRENAPHLFPWVCQNVMSAESLAKAGNPIQDPQIYPMLYQSDWPPEAQAEEFCAQLQRLRAGCLRYNLIPWPMFNVSGVTSDSLLRFQVYASLAYGAQGIWYFTYADFAGLQAGRGYATVQDARAHLNPTWAMAAEANARVAAWGPLLLGRTAAGVYHTTWVTPRAVRPAPSQLIESMSDDLLAGVLVKPGESPLVMLVDKRVSKTPGELEPREATVQFAAAVTGVDVLEGDNSSAVAGNLVALTLPAGGGQLLRLHGESLDDLCATIEKPQPAPGDARVGPDGLILHLTFDEPDGDVARDSGPLGNDTTLARVTRIEGHLGRAISFEGRGNYGRIRDANLPATDAMTVAAWVRPRYPEVYGPVVLVGSGGLDRFEFGFGPDNLYPVITDSASHSGAQLYVAGMRRLMPEGQWGHIAVCAGSGGATTYINGKPVCTTDYIGSFNFEVRQVQLGVRGNEEYDGDLDDVRIWNRCLSAEEVAALAAR